MSKAIQKPTKRRELRFESIADVLRDLDAILEADRRGSLVALGTWTPGQIMTHLASWIEYGYDGYPMSKPMFLIRWILRLKLRSMLHKRMPAGVRIPGIPNGTLGADPLPIEAGADRLRSALKRLESGEPCSFDSPAFGAMSHADRILLNLRHAELHLSFLQYST